MHIFKTHSIKAMLKMTEKHTWVAFGVTTLIGIVGTLMGKPFCVPDIMAEISWKDTSYSHIFWQNCNLQACSFAKIHRATLTAELKKRAVKVLSLPTLLTPQAFSSPSIFQIITLEKAKKGNNAKLIRLIRPSNILATIFHSEKFNLCHKFLAEIFTKWRSNALQMLHA